MKKLFSTILLTAALALSSFAQQQFLGTNAVSYPSGGYAGFFGSTFNGGTNNFTGATTNTYFVLQTNVYATYTNTNAIPSITWPVAMHPNVGLVFTYWSLVNTSTNGSNIFKLVRSFDNGATYETTPFLTLTNILPTALQMLALGAAQTNTVCFDVGVTNATHLGIQEIDNTGVNTIHLTNVSVGLNLNNPTTFTLPAPR